MNWEKITINRKTREMKTEHLQPISQGYIVKEGDLIKPAHDEKETSHLHTVFDDQGIKSWKIDSFKMSVERTLKAMKYAQFDKE